MPILDADTILVAFISLLLLAVAVAMMVMHVRTWRTCRQQQADTEEFDYRRRQFRRRMQTSAMVALLAVALSVGHVLVQWIHSDWFAVGYWATAMLAACWVGLLALVDLWATQHHFGRKRYDDLVEEALIQAEARRILAEENDVAD